MVVALKFYLLILSSCAVFVQADVSHLAYNRYRGQRVRLQRLESAPTPYPAAGYRPNREFGLPSDQPLFPLANQNSNRPQQASSGFDNLSEPQKPQSLYGSPDQEPRYRPQNGFNNLAEPDQNEFVLQYPSADSNRQPQQTQNSNNGFNNFAEPQQPEFVQQTQEVEQPQSNNNGFNNGFNNLAEPQQRPELVYGAPNFQEQEAQSARLRQRLIARLQQAERLEQLQQQAESQRYRKAQSQQQQQHQQQFFNSPQTLYAAPSQQQRQIQSQAQAESQTSRFIVQKPERLTDNREETEPESDAKTSETVEDIETTTKAESKKTVNQTVATNTTPVVANTGVVSYYPATAFGFVQPLNGQYVASANYQTLQPFSPAYTVGSPFLPQQYAVAGAAPAQLQAW